MCYPHGNWVYSFNAHGRNRTCVPRRARIFAVSSEEEQHVSQPEVDRSQSGERQNSRKESQNTLDQKRESETRPKSNSNPLQYHYATWAFYTSTQLHIIDFSENLKFIIIKITSSQRTCLFLFLLPDKALYPLFLLVFFCFPDFYTGLFLRLQ